MEVSFSKIGSIGLGIFSFIRMVQGTLIDHFFRWIPLLGDIFFSPVFDFVTQWFAYLGGLCFAVIFLQWTRNVYVLLTLAVLFILFVKFGLRHVVGVG